MSWLSTVAMIWVSFLKPLAKSGRIGRSIRPANQGFLFGRPPFTLEKTAGDLAGGVGLFLVVHCQRKEIQAGLGLAFGNRCRQYRGVAVGDHDCAVRLAGNLTCFNHQRPVRPT